ncbi:MAG: SagB family peptide dehydrogenase [Candidatus Acidiferrales bacterium]
MRKKKRALFRRSPFLVSYWHGERLVFENYATGNGASAAPLTAEVLSFFSRWRSAAALFEHLPQYSPSSLRAAIQGLVRYSLLQRSDRKAHPTEKAMAAWKNWNPAAGFFHFTGRDVPFEADLVRMGRYMEELTHEKAMPVPVKRYARAAQTRLLPPRMEGEFPRVLTSRRTWRRFAAGRLAFADLSTLLGLTWGVREWVTVPPLGRFAVKTSPSGGALHPIEAYVVAREVEGVAPGIYHYDADGHRLERLRRGITRERMNGYVMGQRWFSEATAMVLMTAVFTRTQWKYRYPRAYRVVLAETGHLCQTFCLVATWLGLAPFCTMAIADSKIDRDLGLDGVTEGVLYVAGVGKMPEGVDWKTASLPVEPTGKKRGLPG